MHHYKTNIQTLMNLFKSKEGTMSIQREGKNLICPFIPPTVQANAVGQPQLVYASCGDMCVHFNIKSLENSKADLLLTCGTHYTNIVEIIEEKPEKIHLFQVK